VLDLANLATSTLLGLLVAILTALLVVRRARTGTPALAGTPLVALAAARGSAGKGNTHRTGRTRTSSAGRGNSGSNGTGRSSSATGTGRSTTRNSGKVNGNGGKADQPAPAPRARAPKPASSTPAVNPVSADFRSALWTLILVWVAGVGRRWICCQAVCSKMAAIEAAR